MSITNHVNNCENCDAKYTIAELENNFFKKIGLPRQNKCSQCRMQRRFAWRNERQLYYRKCDLTGKQIVSIYHPKSAYTVYDQYEWHADKWDGTDYAMDFDFSRPFFQQFDELMKKVPKISVFASRNENSDYTNGAQQDKNCYMIFVSDHNEDCLYSYAIDSCNDCAECLNCYECTLCLECIDCSGSYNLVYSEKSHNCRDSYFLSDCKNCENCIGCFGLRGKKYHILNMAYSREEYEAKLKSLNVHYYQGLKNAREYFQKEAKKQQIFQYYDGNNNENSTGDHIVSCRNCIECYDSGDLEDCGNLIFSFKSKDCFDGHVVVDKCELCYETIATINQYNTQFTFVSFYSKNGMYLDHCISTEDCFACSGLKKKKYCIFNRQYTREDYEKLRAGIEEHMKKTGEWGQPMPIALSPFGYNETVAQEYFPLSKEECLMKGYKWSDEVNYEAEYQGPVVKIPDSIADTDDEVIKKIFLCKKSGKPYKIIPQELRLYKMHKVSLPKFCFDERHKARIVRRNPRHLWERKCMKCGVVLETSYAPERPETIYCGECYLKKVY